MDREAADGKCEGMNAHKCKEEPNQQTNKFYKQEKKYIAPEIAQLAEDPQWRVRLAIVQQMPLLAKTLGSQQFEEKLTPTCLVSTPLNQ